MCSTVQVNTENLGKEVTKYNKKKISHLVSTKG